MRQNILFWGLVILSMLLFGCTLKMMLDEEKDLIHTIEVKKKELREIENTKAELESRKNALIQEVDAKRLLAEKRSMTNAQDIRRIDKIKGDIRTLNIKLASLEKTVAEYKKELLSENPELGSLKEKENKIRELEDQINELLQMQIE